MQHLEDFRRLYFHMCEYLGMKSGFSGGKRTAFMCVCIRIYKHVVYVGIYMQERLQFTENEIKGGY